MSSLPTGTVTFLFTDMEGSTRLLQEVGQESYGSALSAFLARQREAIEGHDGVVVGIEGEGVFAAFERASDAMAAAVDAQRALQAEEWPAGHDLRARMGMHTGEADVVDDSYVGLAVNIASRIADAGHGGQVLLSHAAVELAREHPQGVELADLGAHRLKDVVDPLRLYELRHPELASGFSLPRTLTALPHNLPIQTTSFVGRDELVREVVKLLDEAALVTLTGVGGVGKTRLALRVAEELLSDLADGAWLCELGPVRDAEAIPHAVASELGVQQSQGRSMTESLTSALGPKELLVLLDNCEHVLVPAAQLAEVILRSCPKVRILATSREGLAVPGEQCRPIPPLALPTDRAPVEELTNTAAIALFCDRARGVRPEFQLTADNEQAVVDICRRLDGVPLAIELAAARTRSMAARDIADRLSERFRLLTGGRRTAVERQQTLRSAVEWSYGLLTEDERKVFDRLSVFAGGFELDAAEVVCSGSGIDELEVATLLDGLVDKSMVVAEDDGGVSRYGLLETLRQYGAERLEERGESDSFRARFADHYVELTERAWVGLRGPDEAAWVARITHELDNYREIVGWALDAGSWDRVLRMSSGLAVYAYQRLQGEIFHWLEAAVEIPEAEEHPLFPVACGWAAWGVSQRGELERADDLAASALRTVPETGDPRRETALFARSINCLYRGDLDQAIVIAQEAHELAKRADDDYEGAYIGVCLALAQAYQGDVEGARRVNEEAMRLAKSCRSITQLAWVLYTRGEILVEEDPERAIGFLEEAISESRKVRSVFIENVALVSIASLRGRHGDPMTGLRSLGQIVRQWHRIGDWQHQWTTLRNLVELFFRVGSHLAAATLDAAAETSPTAAPVFGAHAARLETIRAGLKDTLDADELNGAFEVGRRMADDEAVAYALGEIDRALLGTKED